MNKYNTNPISTFVDQILNKSVSEVVNKEYTNTKPSVNILQLENSFLIQVAAPGLKKEDFDIALNNDKLTVSIDLEVEEKEAVKYNRKEFDFSKFKRSFSIPNNIDKSSIKAKYKLGILEITLDTIVQSADDVVNIDIK